MNFDNSFFYAILQNVADGIVACDEKGQLVFFNSVSQELHGRSAEPVGADDWASHYNLHYADGSGLMQKEDIPLYKAWKGARVENEELIVISADGSKKFMYANGAPIINAEGGIIGAVISLHDVTEINETNKKFADITHLAKKVSNLTPGLTTVFNLNTGVYKYVNKAVENIFGYTVQDLLSGGLGFVAPLIHPDDSKTVILKLRRAIRNANKKYPQYNDNAAIEFEYRVRHKTGVYRWMHTYAVVFSRNSRNLVEDVLTITIDITERRHAELDAKQAKISEDYFRDLADQSPFMIWKVNEKGLCTYVNKSWCNFTGLSFEDSMNLGWSSAFHPEDARPEYEKFMKCFEGQQPYSSKFRVRRKSGEYRWVLAQSNPLKQKDKGYIGSLTDITEQEHAQQETKVLMQKKDEFMSVASHELKTPITSMKAALQIMDRISSSSEENNILRPFIVKANSQVTKLSALVDDLLDVTKIQAGQMELKKSSFNINEMIKECVAQFSFDDATHRIFAENIPDVMIYADKDRLGQVLTNFLSNGIKYSPDRDRIVVEAKLVDDSAKVLVTDFGIGIPENNLSYIFNRFFRVEGTSHKFSGLGLGLFISSQIIEKHKGKIGFNSVEHMGSTFWFTIPVTEA